MPSVRDPIRPPSLTPAEARELHYEALVIDAQQPPATSGFLFNDNMRAALAEMHERGVDRGIAGNRLARMAAREVQTNPEAVKDYVGLWETSGVTIGAGTYIAGNRIEVAFESAVKRIAEARSMIDVLGGEVALILNADDIERVYREGKHGVIIDFQDTVPFGTDIDRIDLFYNLGPPPSPAHLQPPQPCRGRLHGAQSQRHHLFRSHRRRAAQRVKYDRRRQPLQRGRRMGRH